VSGVIFDFGFSILDLSGGTRAAGGDSVHPKCLPVLAFRLASRSTAAMPIENQKSEIKNSYA
jgi:hypothetical protein